MRRGTAHPGLALALGLVVAALFSKILTSGFERLGLAPGMVVLILAGSLLGSLINVPLWQQSTRTPRELFRLGLFVYYRPPSISGQVVAINVGGAVVPMLLSLWLLPHAELWKVGVAVLTVAAVAYRVSHVEPGVGIVMPVLITPIVAGLCGWLLAGGGPGAASLAYIGGSVGTLAGADLLHLPRIVKHASSGMLSIGGAGVFDGIFLVGIVAALLS